MSIKNCHLCGSHSGYLCNAVHLSIAEKVIANSLVVCGELVCLHRSAVSLTTAHGCTGSYLMDTRDLYGVKKLFHRHKELSCMM